MITRNRISSRYFTDTPEELSAEVEAASSTEGLPTLVKVLLVSTAILLTGLVLFIPVNLDLWSGGGGPKTVALSGADAQQLDPGAKVMFGNVQIGRVRETRIVDGQPVALLTIDSNYSDQLTASHEFKVTSLNKFLPGNVGVRVSSPERVAPPVNMAQASIPLRSGSNVLVDDSPLPVNIPVLFYVVVGFGVLAFIGLLVVASKLLKPLIILIVLLALIASGLFVLEQKEIVDFPINCKTQTGAMGFVE